MIHASSLTTHHQSSRMNHEPSNVGVVAEMCTNVVRLAEHERRQGGRGVHGRSSTRRARTQVGWQRCARTQCGSPSTSVGRVAGRCARSHYNSPSTNACSDGYRFLRSRLALLSLPWPSDSDPLTEDRRNYPQPTQLRLRPPPNKSSPQRKKGRFAFN